MDEPAGSHSGYHAEYLRRNPADEANYQKKARGYERKLGPLLSERAAAQCLDLGCGTGLLSYYLRGRGLEVVGVDMSPELIAVARRNVDAEFVVGDALHYVAACERKFDVVFLLNLVEHIPADRLIELLAGVRGVLSDAGFAVVRTPNLNCLGAAGHFFNDPTHCTGLTEAALEQVARAAGFSEVEFSNQFRMQNFSGKVRACLTWAILRALFRLRGGRRPKVFYRNLYARLFK